MDAVLIPLCGRDGRPRAYAKVDAADVIRVWDYAWHLHPTGYVIRTDHDATPRTTVRIHRVICDPPAGMEVDHINGDTLDNRRRNLRPCTGAENCQNVRARGGYSKYRGVSWHKLRQRWIAQVQIQGKNNALGYFADEVDAAIVAEAFRREHMPFSRPEVIP